MNSENNGRPIKSYVLRGRMSAAQKRSYDGLRELYCIPFSKEAVSLENIFGNRNPVTCEIGFGTGEAGLAFALSNPDKNYLGVEVYKAGEGRLLRCLKKHDVKNARVIEHDAVDVVNCMLPPRSVAAFHIFFPDPWMKRKHRKRRLVKRPFTDVLADKLIQGGRIYFASDWEDYAEEALREFSAMPALSNLYGAGFAPRPDLRGQSKFEKRACSARRIVRELVFVRIK